MNVDGQGAEAKVGFPSVSSRAGEEDEGREKFTLWDALKDLGWLPLLLMGVGGLSIIDIVEKAVFEDLNLITPFVIVLDGYNRITALVGALIEPTLQPLIDKIEEAFDWSLQLQPFWRSLFVLNMVTVMGWTRALWRKGDWSQSLMVLSVLSLAALAGSAASGLLPLEGGWWAQGLLAATPVVTLWAATGVATAIAAIGRGDPSEARRSLVAWAQWAIIIGAAAFALASGLSFVAAIADGAGVLVLGGLVAAVGAFYLVQGLRGADRNDSRLGLAVLGGFVTAGLILLSNWVINALN